MKRLAVALTLLVALTSASFADLNVLILGSDSSGDRFYEQSLSQGQRTGTPPFLVEEVATHLRGILEGADFGTVAVATQNIAAGDIDWPNSSPLFQSGLRFSSNLLSWFYWPYGEWKGSNSQGEYFGNVTGTEATRWANLRGEAGTPWDYVVLIEDPSTIERLPGFHTLGVAKIAAEVAKGAGQAVLLMTWPSPGSDSTLDHYREVIYRTGRSAGIAVAPAGLAWQATGAPEGGSHPSSDGAYIAAASLYSRLFGQSASTSTYNFDQTLADTVHATVQANQGAPQYSGPFASAHPTRMLGDKRRDILHSNRGSSTENRFRRAFTDALAENRITEDYTRETYSSDTPDDDGGGWPFSGDQLPIGLNWGRHQAFASDGSSKSYFTNPAFWQLGFGFAYQSTDDSVRARGLMAGRDFYVGYLMDEGTARPTVPEGDPTERADEITTARLIPVHVLYSLIQQEFPTHEFKSDQSHLSRAIDVAAANYLGTLYSGRTLVPDVTAGDELIPDPALKRHAQRVGNEVAWMVGTLQARAPAFKVTPASADESAASEVFALRFLNPPQADVTVNVAVSDPTLAEVSRETLVFTPENFSRPQMISSRARFRANGSNVKYDVTFTTTSADEVFDGLTDSWAFSLPSNAVPSINISPPSENENLPVGTDLIVAVSSEDPDGSVAHLTLWINDKLVRQDATAPYRWSVADGDTLLENLDDDVYELRVQAVDNQGASHTVTRTITVGSPEVTPAAAPGGLTASPAYGLVTLNWDANTEGDFQSYSVFRSTTQGVYASPIVTGLTSSEFVDPSVINGTTYFYVVTATDIFQNESAFSAERTVTPQAGTGAKLFGSARDGFGGLINSAIDPTHESWTLLTESVRYINDDPDGINFGVEGGTKDATLLAEFPLDRSDGATHTVTGVVNLSDGYADDNNRLGIYLFGGSAQPSGIESGALHLLINLDTNLVQITRGINGATLTSTTKVGALNGDALIGSELIFTAELTFTGSNISIVYSLRDANPEVTTQITTVSASEFPGSYFGFATRARTRGVNSSDRTATWTMDYKSFGVLNTGTPAPPEGLQAIAAAGFVTLSWDASADPGASRYRVYRSYTAGNYDGEPLAGNLITNQYGDVTVESGHSYFYVVTAVNQSGTESNFSNEASLTYFPPKVDSDNNGIDDAWELEHFDEIGLIDGGADADDDGILDFFEYLADSDPNDAASRGFPLRATREGNAGAIIYNWETAARFVFGSDYVIEVSTDLNEWVPLPSHDYTVSAIPGNGTTRHQLEVTHDYGNHVFIRLVKP